MARPAMRDSWRQQGRHGASAVAWLMIRRIVATLIVVGLLGVFAWIYILAFLQPRTYMTFMTSGQHLPLSGQPVEFAFEDFESLTRLQGALARQGGPPLVFTGVESPRRFEERLNELAQLRLRGRDVLILYIAAHGTVRDGEPFLKCGNFDRADPDKGLYRVADLLDRLNTLPAKTKLLILDSGREESDFRSTGMAYAFPRFVERQVQELADPRLWVLTSNSSLERSHVAPSLRQSVFGYVLSRGLHGAADVDQNEELRIDELCQFVQDNVSNFVERATDGNDSQTPQLFHHPSRSGEPSPALLSLKRITAAHTEPDVADDIEEAQTADSSSMLADVGAFIVGVSGKFGIPSPTQIKSRTEPLQKIGQFFGGDDGVEETDGGEDTDGSAADGETPATGQPSPDLNWDQVAARRLADAWKLTASIESATPHRSPHHHAPHLWQTMLARLLWFDQLHQAGAMADQQLVATEVQRLVRQLRFLAGDNVAEPRPDTLGGQVVRALPAVPLHHEDVRSLALVERITADPRHELPAELAEFIVAYDQAIAAQSPAQLSQLMQEKGELAEPFYESRLAADMLSHSEVPWDVRSLALRTRREGEQAAADLLCGDGWARSDIELADRVRREAERLLFSRADQNWLTLARRNLVQARSQYQAAQRATQVVRSAMETRDRVLVRCHDYIRWYRLGSGDNVDSVPQRGDLIELVQAVTGLDAVLTAPQRDTAAVDRRLEDLRFAVRRIGSGLNNDSISDLSAPLTGNGWRMSVLARTGLLSAGARETLYADLPKVSAELDRGFQFVHPQPTALLPDSSINDEIWSQVQQQIEVEQLAAGLSSCSADTSQLSESPRLDALDIPASTQNQLSAAGFQTVASLADAPVDDLSRAMNADTAAAETLRDQARWRQLEAATARLAQYYADLPDSIAETASAASAPDDQRSQLRRAIRDLHLIHEDIPALTRLNLATQLELSDWYNLLVWHAHRFQQATADTTVANVAALIQSSNHYVRLANKIPGQPSPPDVPARQIGLTSDSEIVLDSSRTDSLDLTIRSKSSEESPVWIVLQYDPEMIQITKRVDTPTYHEHDLRERLRNASSGDAGVAGTARLPRAEDQIRAYPYRPDLFGLPPTLRLGANESQSLTIPIRRQEKARGQATLIVKALGAGTYAREEGKIRLPGRQMYRLLVTDPVSSAIASRDVWSDTGQGVLLQPYPNRPHAFAFSIEDVSNRGGEVQVELFAPSRAPPRINLPEGALSVTAAAEQLALFGSRKLIAQTTVQIPPQGAARVTFPPPEGEGAATAAVPAPATEPPDDGKPQGEPVSNGLLMVITDAKTQKKSLRRIDIRAQRPSRFLSAQASYDAASEILAVDVETVNEDALPPEGLTLELDFAEPLTTELASRLRRRLTRSNNRTRLYAPVPVNDQREMTARLSVNGFPRAFVFTVPCTSTVRNIPPRRDLREVRVASPKQGAAFKSEGLSVIPARFEIDAPTDAFSEADADFVQVGIDSNQNLDLNDPEDREQTLTLVSDRQVSLRAQALTADGTLTLFANVSDFDVSLPADGLNNKEAFVLGRLVTGNQETLSRASDRPEINVVIDGTGPVFRRVDIIPERSMPIGSEITIKTTVTDRLTRAVKVEVGFDELGKDDFSGVANPVEAKPDSQTGWDCKIEVPKLAAGPQMLWLRATDAVGNVTDVSYGMTFLPKEQEADAPQNTNANSNTQEGTTQPQLPKTMRVSGTVKYGKKTLTSGKVSLFQGGKSVKQSSVNGQGRFSLSGIPPGDYELQARSVSGGNVVRISEPVTIDASPSGKVSLGTIKLK